MNRQELIEAMGKDNGLSKKENEAALKAFINVASKALKKGDTVQLVGFGTFSVNKRKARNARNPQTGETIKIKASKAPHFKAGKGLKDLINGVKK